MSVNDSIQDSLLETKGRQHTKAPSPGGLCAEAELGPMLWTCEAQKSLDPWFSNFLMLQPFDTPCCDEPYHKIIFAATS